jgi:MFS superfamily sulfate permease-like transporter
LTGLAFFLLGFFRLGSLLGFFPRHILVGCIGGVGVFLIITGLNVSTRLQDDDFSLSLDTLLFFWRGHNLALWVPAFALAALLRVITSRWHHQLILPTCAFPPLLFMGRLIGVPFLFLSVDRRFLDNTGGVLYRHPWCRVRPGYA